MLAKAATLAVDEIVVDLEDAVVPAAKTDATRRAVAEALAAGGWSAPTLAVRVNGLDTPWGADDIDRVVRWSGGALDSLVIPKVESAHALQAVVSRLDALERELRLPRPIALEVQIESALGLVHVEQIAAASSRLEALIFGPGDFAASLGVVESQLGGLEDGYPGDRWSYARSRIAVAARAFGLAPIDGPFAALDDPDGLRESATRARLLGFAGKWVIHPDQIAACNAVFSPSEEELERARAVLDALARSEREGSGAATHEGAMIDEASRRMAEAVIAQAEGGS
jgi:citrate lyase subunit beta/citryl-CoA lyase